MSDLISIIVPVYNVENYLIECLDSLIAQTYKNIEILLIDDGSTDQSKVIAQTFCKAHSDRTIQLIEKKNGGQSSARNLGIKHAKGTYFIFIDSDDLVAATHVEMLYNAVKEKNSKLAMCKCTKNRAELSDTVSGIPETVQGDFLELVNTLYASDYPAVSAWGKIYHRSLLENVQFYEGIIYEDGIFFYEIIDKISEIILVDAVSYYYRTAENSTLTSKISKKNFDILKKNELTLAFFEEKHPEALSHFYRKALNVNDFIAVKCVQDKTELSQELFDALYAQNVVYSKSVFPRKYMYGSKSIYRLCIVMLSKIFNTNKNGKENSLKRIIGKIVK